MLLPLLRRTPRRWNEGELIPPPSLLRGVMTACLDIEVLWASCTNSSVFDSRVRGWQPAARILYLLSFFLPWLRSRCRVPKSFDSMIKFRPFDSGILEDDFRWLLKTLWGYRKVLNNIFFYILNGKNASSTSVEWSFFDNYFHHRV